MNKKALFALAIAILIPLISYYAVKWASTGAVVLPKKYFFDTVITRVEKGKQITDTVWHKTANIQLVNQLGDSVQLYDIQNKIIVADFIFTHCAGICPALTRNMRKVQNSFANYREGRKVIDSSIVHFLSFSIDPLRDSATQLKNFADRFGVNHDNWWLLTGDRKKIYDFIFQELKVDHYSEEPIDSNFIHTNKMVLLDKDFVVRGFYNGLDSNALAQMARDIGLLMLERNKTAPRKLPFDPINMLFFFVLAFIIVVTTLKFLFKKN